MRSSSIFGDAREVANVNHLVINERMKYALVAELSSVQCRLCNAALCARSSVDGAPLAVRLLS